MLYPGVPYGTPARRAVPGPAWASGAERCSAPDVEGVNRRTPDPASGEGHRLDIDPDLPCRMGHQIAHHIGIERRAKSCRREDVEDALGSADAAEVHIDLHGALVILGIDQLELHRAGLGDRIVD